MGANRTTEALVEFALNSRFEDLPQHVVHATKRVILDTIGCVIASHCTDMGQIILRLKVTQGGKPESTLVVTGKKVPCPSASYVHAALANAMDADETLHHKSHFAGCIVMPAIAIAELTGASGKDLLAAVAVGFDVGARIGLSMPWYQISPEGRIEMNPVVGMSWAAYGTAIACARLLGLPQAQFANALGITALTTPLQMARLSPAGVPKPMTKYAMYGSIAEAGVASALLARGGFTGDPGVLDEDRHFYRALGMPSADWAFMLRDLGRRWFITETSFKPYPVGRQFNLPIDLLLKLMREEHLAANEIERVTVRVPPITLIRTMSLLPEAPSQVDAAFSIPYTLAMAASGIPPGPKWHHQENWRNPDLMDFAKRVTVEAEPSWYPIIVEQLRAEGHYKRLPTGLTVTARGREFKAYGEYAKGDPWTTETTMSDSDLQSKFQGFASGFLTQAKVDDAINAIMTLEIADSLKRLVRCLC